MHSLKTAIFSTKINDTKQFLDRLPLREKARVKMASRDMCFREAIHENLKEYIDSVTSEDFQKFLGEKSMELDQRLEEYKEALKRLKERE